MTLAYFLLGLGIALLILGIALSGFSGISTPSVETWTLLAGGGGLLGLGAWLRKLGRDWAWELRARRSTEEVSPLAASLTQQLYGSHPPYIIEAAKELAAARDTTAVPALLCALEGCVNAQYPGWREVAEALATALEQIGDRRALPLLYRLENVRGIGLIPAIRNAIAAIEPQTSLLRAGSAEPQPEILLRPAASRQEEDPALLLRATNHDLID